MGRGGGGGGECVFHCHRRHSIITPTIVDISTIKPTPPKIPPARDTKYTRRCLYTWSLYVHCVSSAGIPSSGFQMPSSGGGGGVTLPLAVGGTMDDVVGVVVDGVSVGAKYKVHSHSVSSC